MAKITGKPRLKPMPELLSKPLSNYVQILVHNFSQILVWNWNYFPNLFVQTHAKPLAISFSNLFKPISIPMLKLIPKSLV